MRTAPVWHTEVGMHMRGCHVTTPASWVGTRLWVQKRAWQRVYTGLRVRNPLLALTACPVVVIYTQGPFTTAGGVVLSLGGGAG